MKKITLLALLITAFASAQQECHFVCHQGTVVKTLNENALQGHLKHGDTYLGTCDTFTGDSCEVLSLPKLDFTKSLPLGSGYVIYDISGRLISVGVVEGNFYEKLPKKGLYLLKVEGYKTLKFIK